MSTATEVLVTTPRALSIALGALLVTLIDYRLSSAIMSAGTAVAAGYLLVMLRGRSSRRSNLPGSLPRSFPSSHPTGLRCPARSSSPSRSDPPGSLRLRDYSPGRGVSGMMRR